MLCCVLCCAVAVFCVFVCCALCVRVLSLVRSSCCCLLLAVPRLYPPSLPKKPTAKNTPHQHTQNNHAHPPKTHKVKIAELPLDCFRMLQALEWDDAFSSAAPPATEHPAPVKGATIIGNGPDALTRVKMIGNDLKLDTGVGTCGKNGQSVPVGVGQPSLLIEGLTVGGTAA